MSTQDSPDHWLWRLGAPQWLASAQTEWHRAQAHLAKRRTCLTHLRRACGMGLNAVLVHASTQPDLRSGFDPVTHWGRSYMDHLRRFVQDTYPLRAQLATPVQRLLDLELSEPQPALVALRTGPSTTLVHALHDCQELLEGCIEYIECIEDT